MHELTCEKCGWTTRWQLIVCKRCGEPFPLDTADHRFACVVSYPKSGRTWLSHLFYHYTLAHFDATDADFGFTYRPEVRKKFQLLLLERGLGHRYPIVLFNHGGFRSSLEKRERAAEASLRHPTLFLVRDPRHVVVSHYHHLRTKGPERPESLSAFLRDERFGIARVVEYMNVWARHLRAGHPNLAMVRYTALRADTPAELGRVLVFLGVPEVREDALAHAIDESSFETMQRRERERRPDAGGPADALRVRKGALGGRLKEVGADDRAYIDQVLRDRLDPFFTDYLPA